MTESQSSLTRPDYPVHFIQVPKKGAWASATLAPELVSRVESRFSGAKWWADRWTQRPFRECVCDLLRETGRTGLVVLGPRMTFEPPSPFDQSFEPIALSGDPQIKQLTGEARTREERVQLVIFSILGVAGAIGLMGLLVTMLLTTARAKTMRILMVLLGALVLTMLIIVVVTAVGSRWYLVPGGVVIRGRKRARNRPEVHTRCDTVPLFRWVSNGKTTMLMLELLKDGKKVASRPMSEREALAFLAAWQSDAPTPSDAMLAELVS